MREAVLKYEVKHPVINDEEMIFWDNMERRSWPSIAILSPDGCPLLFLSGEGHRSTIDQFLEAAVDYYDDRLDRVPIEIYLEEHKELQDRERKAEKAEMLSREERAALNSNLKFPGKLICIASQP